MFPVLIYDGDCAFCNRAVTWTTRYVRPDATIVAAQEADLWALGVDPQQCQRSIQWVARPGVEPLAEGAAVAAVLKAGTWPWRILGRMFELPGIRSAVSFGYRRVAANRHRLPGGSRQCKLPAAAA